MAFHSDVGAFLQSDVSFVVLTPASWGRLAGQSRTGQPTVPPKAGKAVQVQRLCQLHGSGKGGRGTFS